MRPGKSLSDREPSAGGIASWNLSVLIVSGVLVTTGAFAEENPIPLPLPNAGEDRTAPTRLEPAEQDPDASYCPRCRYRREIEWRYCPSCGWDLGTLVGDEAGRTLEALGQATVGLIVTKEKLAGPDLFPASILRILRRYGALGNDDPGQRKVFGTAFPYGEVGLFLTSARLLDRAVELKLRTLDNRTYTAEVVGYDLATGIGVLKAELPDHPVLDASLTGPRSETTSWVVCYPIALEDNLVRYLPFSVHRGRVTATGAIGTNLVAIENLVRTDHTLPHGCGGAPLIDPYGRPSSIVIGTPTAGMTYSLPLADLEPVINAIARGETIERPFFGIGLVPPDLRRRARFSLPAGEIGPLVPYVIAESPADMAGVRPGDLLVSVGDEMVSDVLSAAKRLLAPSPGGAPIILTFSRDGQELRVPITPTTRPRRVLLDPSDEIQESLEANLEEVTTGRSSEHGLRISFLRAGGRGENSGYREGDVIQRVDGKSIRRIETFNRLIRKEYKEIFGVNGGPDEPHSKTAFYSIGLEIRTSEGEKKRRSYTNFFPDMLSAPIY